jgi:hypothetical protein
VSHAWTNYNTANLTASDGGATLTKTANDGAYDTAEMLPAHSVGKYVFEVSIPTSAYITGIGLTGDDFTLSDGLDSPGAVGYFSLNDIWVNGVHGSDLGTYTDGDTVRVAVDLTARLIWFRVNSGNWNNDTAANPATGAGGIDISALTGPLRPAITVIFIGNVVTGSFASISSRPSGFRSWGAFSLVAAPVGVWTSEGFADGVFDGDIFDALVFDVEREFEAIAAPSGTWTVVPPP